MSAKATGNKTMSKTISAEQHNETRRRVKAHQQATRRRGGRNGRPAETLFDGIRADRQKLREEAAARRKEAAEKRLAQQLEFRQAQATMAAQLLDNSLYGVALTAARRALETFPVIEHDPSTKRFAATKKAVVESLTPEQAKHTNAITLGFLRANSALNLAFGKLKNQNAA